MIPLGAIGIEFEIQDVSLDTICRHPSYPGDYLRTTHDASVETTVNTLGDIRVGKVPKQIGKYCMKRTIGGEFVSTILTIPDYKEKVLDPLCNILVSKGETYRSDRAGFHVHVNIPVSLDILKRIIRLGLHLETVFFHLGGMGYTYRGVTNNSIFCRPISKDGPVCVRIGRNIYGKVMNIDDLLSAKTIEDFALKYGDLYNQQRNVGKYVPVRYTFLNLVPLFTQGSLEFRVFNKSLESKFLWAAIEFCRHFVNVVVENRFPSCDSNSIYGSNKYDAKNILLDFAKKTGLEDKVVDLLLTIIEYSVLPPLVNDLVFSHLMFHAAGDKTRNHWEDVSYKTPKETKDKIIRPVFIDSHNVRDDEEIPIIQGFQPTEEEPREVVTNFWTTTPNFTVVREDSGEDRPRFVLRRD